MASNKGMRTDFLPLLCLVVVGSEIRDPRSGIRENIPDPEHCVGHRFLCYYLGRKRKVIKVISHHLFTNSQMELGTVYRSAIAQCTTCRVFNEIENEIGVWSFTSAGQGMPIKGLATGSGPDPQL
jgi:hypothetical protein